MSSKKERVYKLPLPRLVEFFKNSRDSWKNRHHELRDKVTSLENKLYYQTNKNTKLKDQIQKLQDALDQELKKSD